MRKGLSSSINEIRPYRSWHHQHHFEAAPGGTQMHDGVDYEVPYGFIGKTARALFVRSTLERIYDY